VIVDEIEAPLSDRLEDVGEVGELPCGSADRAEVRRPAGGGEYRRARVGPGGTKDLEAQPPRWRSRLDGPGARAADGPRRKRVARRLDKRPAAAASFLSG
jgi:hypothetical protein